MKMKKECCNIKVSETDKGFNVEIEGEDVKSKCKEVIENCCTKDNIKDLFQSCCGSKK